MGKLENVLFSLINNIELFFIILSRISGFFITVPIFSSRNIPAVLKSLIISLVSLVLFIVLMPKFSYISTTLGTLVLQIVIQFFLGVTMGYVVNIVFAAIQLAGQAIDMQMGFGIVNVVDPQSGMQMPLIGIFKYLLALLVFLFINGHHYLLDSLHKSFILIPLGSSVSFVTAVPLLLKSFAGMFVIALQIAVPVVGAVFISDWVLGFMARTVPQLNIFMVGLPIKIIIGFAFLSLGLPVYLFFLESLLINVWDTVDQVMRLLV